MSFIPQNNAGINVITPKPGSGLTVSTTANVDTITTDNILQGTGIVLTRNTTLNTLTINSSALGSGVVSVTEQNPSGSGIIVTSSPGPAVAVTLQGGYVAGSGISMTPSATPGNQTVSVANTMDITSAAGSGIAVTQAGPGQDAQLVADLSAGAGIAITAPGGTTKQIANAMAVSGSGAGITVTQAGAGQNVTIANAGVTSAAVSGAGLSVSAATGAVTFQNTGVTSLAAGSGISVSAGTGAITVGNTMALTAGNGITVTQSAPGANATIATNISAGQGIQVSGTTNRVIQNTMTLSAAPGSGITVSQASPGANAVIGFVGAQDTAYFNLGQPDPSTYGFGYIVNGGQLGFGLPSNVNFDALCASAPPAGGGSVLIQFTLQLSSSPATPPGGPIQVQFYRAGTALTGVTVNSPTIYPSPYQTGGTYTISGIIPFSSFFGTLSPFDIRVTNNYGAVIYAVLMSPVIAQYVPLGIN